MGPEDIYRGVITSRPLPILPAPIAEICIYILGPPGVRVELSPVRYIDIKYGLSICLWSFLE